MRKPVAAAVLRTVLMVVCDDGSLWELDPDGRWIERRPIPGTPADQLPWRADAAEPIEAT